MKNYKTNFIETKIHLLPETKNTLNLMAKNNGMSMSSLTRSILEKHLSQQIADESAGVVASIVRNVIKDVIRAETDRLAKLIIKTMKASAAGMYLSAQAVEDIGQNKGSEILEEAFNLAVKYIKVSYDPKDYAEVPLKPAKSETVAINMADIANITDEELLNMTI